jgi:hypothetical protein
MIRVALVAALAGSVIGAATVLAAGDSPPAVPIARSEAKASPTPTPPPERNARILKQVEDPKGGAPWAIRAYETDYRTRTGEPRTSTCYQLGRVHDGRVGWIDAEGTFTPTPVTGICMSAAQLHNIRAFAHRVTTVTGEAKPDETATWGIAEPGATELTLDREPSFAPGEAFLRVKPGDAPRIERTRVRFADGTVKDNDPFQGYPGERIVPGSQQVAAVTPDPAGGPPWALMTVRGERGSTCISGPGRLAGNHLGSIDPQFDILVIDPFELRANCKRKKPTRAFPMRLDTMIAGVQPDPEGRNQLRVIDGRIVFSGTVHPDVRTVTITTPRDVRTLVPTRAHAIIAVYAGLFPGGKATATARFDDGTEVTRSLYVE